MQHEWNIKSPSSKCHATGRSFEVGTFFYTLLFHDSEGYERLDLSEAAWEERKKDSSLPSPLSLWRSKYELPPPPPPEPLPKGDAEGMLRYLLKTPDQKQINICYILALMLERKKILKPRPSLHASLLAYTHARTGESFLIEDPHLSLEGLEVVQQEVVSFLSSARKG